MTYQSNFFCTDCKIISVWNKIHDIGIYREKVFPFAKPCLGHLLLYLCVNLQANFTNKYLTVICYPNRLSTYPTEIYDASKQTFTTSQKFHWATLKRFNWKPSLPFPCTPMLDFQAICPILISKNIKRKRS